MPKEVVMVWEARHVRPVVCAMGTVSEMKIVADCRCGNWSMSETIFAVPCTAEARVIRDNVSTWCDAPFDALWTYAAGRWKRAEYS